MNALTEGDLSQDLLRVGYAALMTATFVVAATLTFSAHKQRTNASAATAECTAAEPPSAGEKTSSSFVPIANLNGKISTEPDAVAPRSVGRRGCTCGSRALVALYDQSEGPLPLLVILRTLLTALLRTLACRRYCGPQLHPTSAHAHVPYAVADAWGRREYMEDRHVVARLTLGLGVDRDSKNSQASIERHAPGRPGSSETNSTRTAGAGATAANGSSDGTASDGQGAATLDCTLYAVFDGHAGTVAAEHSVRTMPQVLQQALTAQLCRRSDTSSRSDGGGMSGHTSFENQSIDPLHALSDTFSSVDDEFLSIARSFNPPLNDGCTALAALVVGDRIYVANGEGKMADPLLAVAVKSLLILSSK